jgi:hypothetical protein
MSDLVSGKTFLKMILKMNFNFNFKDMPPAPQASIHHVTNVRDRHHTGKYGIKRSSRCSQWRNGNANTPEYSTSGGQGHVPLVTLIG